MNTALLTIYKLSTGYLQKKQANLVLHQHLSLEVAPGELICVLGPNGSGKSTLIRTLLGFHKSMGGEVFYSGKPLKDLPVNKLAKEVSVVLTDRIEDQFLTAYDVIASGRFPYRTLTAKLTQLDIETIESVIQQVGIHDLTSQPFSTLSDGERQKVMIARAMAQDTPLIFLDEPTAFIDSPTKVVLMELLKKLSREEQKGVVMTTHDMEPALRYADRIWLMGTDGKFEEGKPKELIKKGLINSFFDNEEVAFNPDNKRFESKL